MTDEHRADPEKVREVAEDLGTPGQDATPDETRASWSAALTASAPPLSGASALATLRVT
jgi:hypothetical protein